MSEYIYGGEENFTKELRPRIFWFTVVLFLSFFIILARLWYLQVAQADPLRELAENNRLRQVSFAGFRGDIYDRNGVLLVTSRPSFDVDIIREDIADLDGLLVKLGKIIKLDIASTKKKLFAAQSFVPVTIALDILRDQAGQIEEQKFELPGVSLSVRPIRIYRYGSFAAHLIGYLGEISRKQLKDPILKGYKGGDIVGKSGVEKSFEPILRGADGNKIIEVDATGRELRTIKKVEAGVGKDLYLSLDFETQRKAEELMEGKQGAIVAMRPQTGEVLAFVSAPGFDLNQFAYGVEPGYWRDLLKNEHHPLNNRPIQGLYAPASTYKIIVALAALEEGHIETKTKILCEGYFKLGRRYYRCWNRRGHGYISLHRALAQSCDIYFYELGLKLGVNKIAEWAKHFGLGSITGIALEHERSGLIPTKDWKRKVKKRDWILGETISIAIGQGYNLVTPLQLSTVISSVANGGKMVQPRLLKVSNEQLSDPESLGRRELPFKKENLDIINWGLYGVVNSRYGTGARSGIIGVKVAGKTGTSQVVTKRSDDYRKLEDIPVKLRDHALFVGYAPYSNPEISVVVVLEHAGGGGTMAAPISQKVIKAYLKNLKKIPIVEEVKG